MDRLFASSDKSIVLRAFNKHFFEFLDDLIVIYPDNENILIAKETFETFKKANPTIIAKVWHARVHVPYSEHILQGNIDFFTEKDYSEDLSDTQNASKVLEMINSVREPLRNMTDANRLHATKYIQNLSRLSEAYVALSS
jgi:hypothetical protein